MQRNNCWEGIKFLWKIENFSCLKDSRLPSPFGSLKKKWLVIILNKNNEISFELPPVKRCTTPFIFNCSFALLNSDSAPLIWRERKNVPSNSYVSFIRFINEDLLFSGKPLFLPNDILTVQCHIWWTANGLARPVPFFAHTRMEPKFIKKTFIWEVADVSSLRPLQFFERNETISNGESLAIKLSLNNDDEFEVILSVTLIGLHVKIITVLLDAASGENIEVANCECKFVSENQKWTFKTNVSKAMIMSHQSRFLPEDKLSLQFTCTFPNNIFSVTFNRLVDDNKILTNITRTPAAVDGISEAAACAGTFGSNQRDESHPPNTTSQALQDMYNEGFLSDFNLTVGDKVFPVHRAFLGVRSQVFRAMFTTEMKEKQDNCVAIQDVDEDTLQRLLQFVYTDRLEKDMGWEGTSSLYAAADKYALEPLKQDCSDILKSGLSVSSVLDVLSMADMHQDRNLKSAALEFISLSDKAIVGSERWTKFEEGNALLALETCRELYLKKINN